MDRTAAISLFARAPSVHLASTATDGTPIFRTLHAVVVDDWLAFHGAPVGEKLEAVGREAVLVAEESVASIPSYFVDPARACPATTLYVSAQAHGVLEIVDDRELKTRVLSEIMAKFQPEGGHVPLDDAMYEKSVDGLLVMRVRLDRVDGKAKLGQHRTLAERQRILEQLWVRGLPGDPAAIERIRHEAPDSPTPRFLEAPPGLRLSCALSGDDLDAVAELVQGEYWNDGLPKAALVEALRASAGVVGVQDVATGRLLSCARLLSDRTKVAWLFDVCVARDYRRRGLGHTVVQLALDHPAARKVRRVYLKTRHAQELYEQFRFTVCDTRMNAGHPVITMVLERP